MALIPLKSGEGLGDRNSLGDTLAPLFLGFWKLLYMLSPAQGPQPAQSWVLLNSF